MSLLVDEIPYSQALRTIREVILDTNPVQAFTVYGQDFLFSKNSTGVTIDSTVYTFTEVEKIYDLLPKLRAKDVKVVIMPDYVANAFTKDLVDFSHASITEPKIIESDRYFSIHTIESLMVDYFATYLSYSGSKKTVSDIYGSLNFFDRRKMIYWVAYYLIDRRRMGYATTGEMIRLASGDSAGEFINKEQQITTRIGEVFTVTETDRDGGKGTEGFTSLWGDQYGYLTKLQLWIRERFEKQFGDYSLRDNAMISQTFVMDKQWEPHAWVNTLGLSQNSMDILQPDNRTTR